MIETDGLKLLGAGIAAGLGMIGPGIGIGMLGMGAMNALGRNPGGPGRHFDQHDSGYRLR